MKILAIMGSPRKKDSYGICELFRENLNAIEPVEFEYMFLRDLGLEFCRGCCLCADKSEGLCPARDVTLKIEQALNGADAVIFASPVYAHQVTALMKNFIDHSCYFFHRPRFFDKAAIVLSTTAGTGLSDVLSYLQLVAVGYGFNLVGRLGVKAPLFYAGGDYKDKTIKQIRELSGKLAGAVKTKKRPSPGLFELVMFRAIRKKVKEEGNTESVNYRYWQERGWFDSNYYLKGPVSPVKNFIAGMIVRLI